jgi:HEAT repeat protein
MNHRKVVAWFLGALLVPGALALTKQAHSERGAQAPVSGVRAVYGSIPADQIEQLSTPERIQAVASSGSMMAIWEALEHGEKVECLGCIPSVEPLLYDANPQTREIAAWWLRRRVFGVFGRGEVYERTVRTLASDPSALRRAHAANALGEFLVRASVTPVATALTNDPDPGVRVAAAAALARLNDDGAGAIGRALGDSDERVKVAALTAAGRINGFSDTASVVRLLGDGSASVRKRAVEILDSRVARDAVGAVMAIAKNDPDAEVRVAACHALGTFGDGAARSTLESIADTDTNAFVRDQARIALYRLDRG